MITWVRQHLVSTAFVPDPTSPNGQVLSYPTPVGWSLGYGYRVIPGKAHLLGGSSPSVAGLTQIGPGLIC
jgi:hypothetical protein